ncbi:hypothetical protein CXP54_23510 [Escherichia albertii]|uniref:hypothetical protein n=1 Tax=Enterobacteriaceae TaxID=543 RepID=UPI000C9F81CD|nr:hypothetical protein [Escherichia albertii]AUS68554.1 hypothetical protein CXP54_23510 [Escherichia albertii]
MAQYDDDEHALQVSSRGREHHHFCILPYLQEATGISYGYRQPLCGMPGARTDPSDPSALRSASDGR